MPSRICALALLLLALLATASAVYIPCSDKGIGYGLLDPEKDGPNEAVCKPCKVRGCTSCTYDYSICEQCPVYTGPANGGQRCKKCRSKTCGVCDDGYDTCTGLLKSCPRKVTSGMSAKLVSYKDIVKYLPKTCFKNKRYRTGNGYVTTRVFTVDKKGRCVECQDPNWWRPLGYGDSDFCWYENQARKVLAGALVGEGSSCTYKDIQKAKLKGQCSSDSRSSNVSITQKWRVKCGGGKRYTVYVEAEGDRGEKDSVYDDFEDGTLQWSVASKDFSPGVVMQY